ASDTTAAMRWPRAKSCAPQARVRVSLPIKSAEKLISLVLTESLGTTAAAQMPQMMRGQIAQIARRIAPVLCLDQKPQPPQSAAQEHGKACPRRIGAPVVFGETVQPGIEPELRD